MEKFAKKVDWNVFFIRTEKKPPVAEKQTFQGSNIKSVNAQLSKQLPYDALVYRVATAGVGKGVENEGDG